MNCQGDCKNCIHDGNCSPSTHTFKAKTDDPSRYCPYCLQKLKRPYSDPQSIPTVKSPTGFTYIPLQCTNPECKFVIKDKKNKKLIMKGIVGHIERSEKVILKELEK